MGHLKPLIFHMSQLENQWFLGVPIFKPVMIRLLFAQILEHLKIINFPFGTNGKFIIFRCPYT